MQIGIFWIYQNKIFSKKEALDSIQKINGFKDSNLSHYEVWEEIKYTYRDFYLYEYEEIPRGRVVWDVENKQFLIYCNQKILKDEKAKALVINDFGFTMPYRFIYDEHYTIYTR